MRLVWVEVKPAPGAKRTWVLCYENGTPYERTLPDHLEVAGE